MHGQQADLAGKSHTDVTSMPDYVERRAYFSLRVDLAINAIIKRLAAEIAKHFSTPLTDADLPDSSPLKAEVMELWAERIAAIWEEWSQQPQLPEAIRRMEDALLRQFEGDANEVFQRAIGVEQYVWRSRDDGDVRKAHRTNDDKVFDWDNPPEGGHPGQDFNCRCWAETVFASDADYVPLTGIAFAKLALGAYLDGGKEAATEASTELLEALRKLPGQVGAVARYLQLRIEAELGTLSPSEAAELARMRTAIDAGIEATKEFLKNAPEALLAFTEYVAALEARANRVELDYKRGLATEEQVRQTMRELGFLKRTCCWQSPGRA